MRYSPRAPGSRCISPTRIGIDLAPRLAQSTLPCLPSVTGSRVAETAFPTAPLLGVRVMFGGRSRQASVDGGKDFAPDRRHHGKPMGSFPPPPETTQAPRA